jgi:6-phosphofructokinase 1
VAEPKRIGILTSGGDCPGLNAAIRAVVFRASEGYGWRVIGIREGTQGLLNEPPRIRELDVADFPGHVFRMAGTILGTTNWGDPFAFPSPDGGKADRSDEFIANYRALGLEALIGIGGDGSMAILRRLAQKGGIDLVTIPKTIDNDVRHTEISIGHDTAVKVATDALDELQPTAASHSRVMVLEVMGRDAGHIALSAGIAGGADVILIPEIPYQIAAVAQKIQAVKDQGRNFSLVVVAEAVKAETGDPVVMQHAGGGTTYGGIGHHVGACIAQATGAETRVTVLGHVQRGGAPTPRDRLMASVFGVHAVDLIAAGKFDRMVAWRARTVIDVPLAEAITAYPVAPDGPLVRTARGLGISFGDA